LAQQLLSRVVQLFGLPGILRNVLKPRNSRNAADGTKNSARIAPVGCGERVEHLTLLDQVVRIT